MLRKTLEPEREEVTGRMREINSYNLVGKLKVKYHLGGLDVEGRITLKWILKKHSSSYDVRWIHHAQDRDQWRAAVNTVMNVCVP
jgi:hypothetical protein